MIPVAAGAAPAVGDRYWWRLVKASALVLIGVSVHLWIDGPQPGERVDPTSSGLLTDRIAEAGSARRAPVLVVAAGAHTTDVPSATPRALATSGHHVALAMETELRQRPVYRRLVSTGVSTPPDVRADSVPDLPYAALPAVRPATRLAGWTSVAVALPPVAIPEPDAVLPPATVTDAPALSASRVARSLPVPSPREEESILQVLHEYETAVGRKDPLAAKAVWPALDDRALARAFNDLQSHSLALEGCGVTVANSNAVARARCLGVATYLPKVGRRKPISASHEWTFNLSKAGGDWQIESAAIR